MSDDEVDDKKGKKKKSNPFDDDDDEEVDDKKGKKKKSNPFDDDEDSDDNGSNDADDDTKKAKEGKSQKGKEGSSDKGKKSTEKSPKNKDKHEHGHGHKRKPSSKKDADSDNEQESKIEITVSKKRDESSQSHSSSASSSSSSSSSSFSAHNDRKSKEKKSGPGGGGMLLDRIALLEGRNKELERETKDLREKLDKTSALAKELQKQNDSLSADAASATSANAAVASRNGEIEQLREENRKLKKKYDSEHEKAKKLSEENSQYKIQLSTSPAKAQINSYDANAVQKYQTEINDLHAEKARLERRYDILKQILEGTSELTFMTQDTPLVAVTIKEALASSGAYDDPKKTSNFKDILLNIRLAYSIMSDSYTYPFYWVQTLYTLLRDSAKRLGSPFPDDYTIVMPDSSFDIEDDSNELLQALEGTLYDAYALALSRVYIALDAILIPAMLEKKDPKITPSSVTAIIANVAHALKEARLSTIIKKQTLGQVLGAVAGGLFNVLVSKPSYCTCGKGLHLKSSISSIEDFVSRDREIASAKKRLGIIKDAANLLLMDTKLLNDDDLIRTALPNLNAAQIAKILENFQPDELAQAKTDPSVLQLMRSRAHTAGSMQVQVDPHAFISEKP